MNRGLFVGLLLALASGATAQMALMARDSDLNLYWLGGYAGDTHGGTPAASDENLYMASGAGLVGDDDANGSYFGHIWSLTVGWNLAHSYQASGDISSASRIQSTGNSSLMALANQCSLTMRSVIPGNRLQLTFTLAEGRVMKLCGTLIAPADPSRGQANVTLTPQMALGCQACGAFLVPAQLSLAFATFRPVSIG